MPECQDSNEYYRRFVLSESISRQTYIHIKMKCLGACCPIAEVTDQATPLSEMRCMLCLWHSDVNHAAGKSRNLAKFRQKRMHGESALSLAASSAAGTSSPHLMLISPGLMLRLSMCSQHNTIRNLCAVPPLLPMRRIIKEGRACRACVHSAHEYICVLYCVVPLLVGMACPWVICIHSLLVFALTNWHTYLGIADGLHVYIVIW